MVQSQNKFRRNKFGFKRSNKRNILKSPSCCHTQHSLIYLWPWLKVNNGFFWRCGRLLIDPSPYNWCFAQSNHIKHMHSTFTDISMAMAQSYTVFFLKTWKTADSPSPAIADFLHSNHLKHMHSRFTDISMVEAHCSPIVFSKNIGDSW